MVNKKGNYVRRLQTNYCVLDVETTGFSPEDDEIIEIAVLRVRKGKINDYFVTFVFPRMTIPERITNLTGITDEMVKNAPVIDEIIDDVLEFIGPDLIVGHNTNFDIRFLAQHRSIENNYVDTVQFARKLYPELKHHRLSDLQKHLSLSNNEHRALSDCMTTYELYEVMKAKMKEEGLKCSDLWPRPQDVEFYKERARRNRTLKNENTDDNTTNRFITMSKNVELVPPTFEFSYPDLPLENNKKSKKELKKSLPMVFVTVFLGWLGVHRFASGQILLGIIYLCTGGLCLFGWAIDSINMILWAYKNRGEWLHKNELPVIYESDQSWRKP